MPLTSQQLQTLKTELTTDPRGYGYAALITAKNWNGLRDAVNLPRPAPVPAIRRTDIEVADIYAAIAVADYTALPGNPTAAQLSTERRFLAWLSGLSALKTVRLLNDDGTDTQVVVNFRAMFAAGTGTINRLVALANRLGTRSEELFGRDVFVTDGEVETALRLP